MFRAKLLGMARLACFIGDSVTAVFALSNTESQHLGVLLFDKETMKEQNPQPTVTSRRDGTFSVTLKADKIGKFFLRVRNFSLEG